jgi:hypothetical protein
VAILGSWAIAEIAFVISSAVYLGGRARISLRLRLR